jgi:hypothetical protein
MRQLRVGVLGRDPACRLCHRSPPSPAARTLSARKTRRLRRHINPSTRAASVNLH